MPKLPPDSLTTSLLRAVTLGAALFALASCAEAPKEQKPISTGLNALEADSPPSVAGEVDPDRQATIDLLAQAQRNSGVSVDAPPVRSSRRTSEPPTLKPEEPAPIPEPLEAEPLVQAPPPPNAATRENLVAELAEQLREQARTSSAPAAALLRLASLELLESKAGDGDPAAEAALTPQEAEFLKSWRELFAAARDGLNSTGDLESLTAQVVGLAERVQAAQPLSILESHLCVRVDGFGMFDEMLRRESGGPYTFIAGKRQRAIVYIEVSNYTHSPKEERGVSGFEVRLSQELELFHASLESDTVVWRRPFQEINDFSRKRRRDFYTTQVIDLPASLGVGAYRLKVSLSDKASSAVAEAIIPIEFVAEPQNSTRPK